jgi:hypothetical protein
MERSLWQKVGYVKGVYWGKVSLKGEKEEMLTIKITKQKWWGKRQSMIYLLPKCQDGYFRKKPMRTFLEALKRNKGKVEIEIKEKTENADN